MYKRPHAPRDSALVIDLLARVAVSRLAAGHTLDQVCDWVSSPSVARQYGAGAQRAVRTVMVGSR